MHKINRSDLIQFGSLEILAKQAVEGFITGLHKSPFHGFSVEFAEHRIYNQGESTKHIDWKLFGKTDRLYSKKYDEETNLRCQFVFDISSSMYFQQGNIVRIVLNFDLTESNFVPDKAIPLGLILNEIISNAFKYAQNENAVFTLNLRNDEAFYFLTFSDNGPGLPKEVPQNTLGLALISILSEQIDAELISESTTHGLTYKIKFNQ